MIDVLKIVNWFRVKNDADMKLKDFTEELTQMKVMKLLYYVQGVYLVLHDKPLFSDEIIAWKYGPAVEKVHSAYKGKRGITGDITQDDLADYEELQGNSEVSLVLNAVNDAYGDMSASELVKQTHSETPWLKTSQSATISNELIRTYFKENIVENG
jgi:uncharacterized phage-associated protein